MADLGDIWTHHAPDALRLCRRYVGADGADDAMGRVALAAQRSFARSERDILNPRAWLLTIARNVCFDIYRERGRDTVRFVGDEVLERAAARRAVAVDYDNPERRYLAGERLRCMTRALQALPMESREPLRLLAGSDACCGVIARSLGIPAATLRKRMQRARELLRKLLGEQERPARGRRAPGTLMSR